MTVDVAPDLVDEARVTGRSSPALAPGGDRRRLFDAEDARFNRVPGVGLLSQIQLFYASADPLGLRDSHLALVLRSMSSCVSISPTIYVLFPDSYEAIKTLDANFTLTRNMPTRIRKVPSADSCSAVSGEYREYICVAVSAKAL